MKKALIFIAALPIHASLFCMTDKELKECKESPSLSSSSSQPCVSSSLSSTLSFSAPSNTGSEKFLLFESANIGNKNALQKIHSFFEKQSAKETGELLRITDRAGNTLLHIRNLNMRIILKNIPKEKRLSFLKVRNIFGMRPIDSALFSGKPHLITEILYQLTPEDKIALLAERDSQGRTLLHDAIMCCKKEHVRVILKSLSPTEITYLLSLRDNNEKTAAAYDSLNILQELIPQLKQPEPHEQSSSQPSTTTLCSSSSPSSSTSGGSPSSSSQTQTESPQKPLFTFAKIPEKLEPIPEEPEPVNMPLLLLLLTLLTSK